MDQMIKDPKTITLCESIIGDHKKYKLSEGPQIFWEYTEEKKLDYYAIYIEILQENKYNNNFSKSDVKSNKKDFYDQCK